MPDILCNQYIKFDAWYRTVENSNLNPDIYVTGHYAINSNLFINWENNNRNSPEITDNRKLNKNPAFLKRATDKNKCQTYFLSRMPKKSLENTIFPVGNLNKNVVKHLAMNEFDLRFLSKKRESMGICFIGKRNNFSEFMSNYTNSKTGKIIYVKGSTDLNDFKTGDILGEHSGLEHFTIGKPPREKFVKWKTKSTRESYFWSKTVNNKPVVIGCSEKDVFVASKYRSKTDGKLHLSRFCRFSRLTKL